MGTLLFLALHEPVGFQKFSVLPARSLGTYNCRSRFRFSHVQLHPVRGIREPVVAPWSRRWSCTSPGPDINLGAAALYTSGLRCYKECSFVKDWQSKDEHFPYFLHDLQPKVGVGWQMQKPCTCTWSNEVEYYVSLAQMLVMQNNNKKISRHVGH